MTEKRLTEARRLANEILPKVQKMQRDMFFLTIMYACALILTASATAFM